jgi:hypothetical protein
MQRKNHTISNKTLVMPMPRLSIEGRIHLGNE